MTKEEASNFYNSKVYIDYMHWYNTLHNRIYEGKWPIIYYLENFGHKYSVEEINKINISDQWHKEYISPFIKNYVQSRLISLWKTNE